MTPVSVLAVPPPPPSANRMGSDDPDEITSWVSRRDGDHSRVVHGTGPYGFRLARIETPVVQIAWASTRLANTLRARFRQPTFHVPLGGVQRYVYGRRRVEAAMGRLVFIASDTEVTRHSDGDPVMAIELDVSTFESEVRESSRERSYRAAASAADARPRGAAAARGRPRRSPPSCRPTFPVLQQRPGCTARVACCPRWPVH